MTTADVNGDGKPDLIVADYSGGVSVLLGNGSGSFSTATTYAAGPNPRSVATADVNGDGKPDLIVADFFGGVSVLLGDGSGRFSTATPYAAGSGPQSVTTADVNSDGKPDLIVADRDGGVSVLLNSSLTPATDTTTSVIDTDPAVAPTISGTRANQTTTDAASLQPFSAVTITAANAGSTAETATITLSTTNGGIDGTLSGSGLSIVTPGSIYTLTAASPAALTTALQALSFTPTPQQVAPGQSVTTDFIIVATQNGSSAYDGNSSVIATAVNNAPVISGTVAGQVTTDYVPIKPFSSAVISDIDTGVTDSVTITLKGSSLTPTDANGNLSGSGLTKTGVGTYVLSGPPASLTTSLQALTFTPTEAEVAAGNTVTTNFTLTATQTAGGATTNATDSTTSVTTTALNYITGPSGGVTFLFGTSGSDVITALGSNNTLYGNGGNDYLTATTGSLNEFVLPNAGDGVATITGFSESNGDILDLVNALLDVGYPLQGGNLANYLKVTNAGSDTLLSVVPGGSGMPVTIAVLNGSANLGLSDLLSHHSLIP